MQLCQLRGRDPTRLQQLTVFSRDTNFYLINVVFKIPFFLLSVWENHAAVTVLDTPNPLPLVARPICPVHLAIPVALVVLVLTFVCIATGPLKLTKATLLVIDVVPLVSIRLRAARAAPLSLTMFHSVNKVSNVSRTALPRILALPLGLAINVFACVRVSIDE